MIRVLTYGISLAIVAVAAMVVPMPFAELVPGGATPIPPLITVDEDVETTPIDGEVSLLTIFVRQPALVDTVAAVLSPTRELERRSDVIPAGIEREEFFRLQRLEFTRSFDLAAAVAVEAAGYDVEVSDAPIVFGVLPDGPSEGKLRTGDVLTAIDGVAISSSEELIAELADVLRGDVVTLAVRRGSERLEVDVRTADIPGLDQPGLGIQVRTVGGDVELPFAIELEETSIGGPSAGLMTAVTVYDLLAEEDLVAGRDVVGTGTIDADGNVGPIGGLPEKVAAAVAADADLMLYPAVQADEIVGVDTGDVELVGVSSFDDALDALRA